MNHILIAEVTRGRIQTDKVLQMTIMIIDGAATQTLIQTETTATRIQTVAHQIRIAAIREAHRIIEVAAPAHRAAIIASRAAAQAALRAAIVQVAHTQNHAVAAQAQAEAEVQVTNQAAEVADQALHHAVARQVEAGQAVRAQVVVAEDNQLRQTKQNIFLL